MKILDGCSRGSVALIVKSIGEAIEIGAPSTTTATSRAATTFTTEPPATSSASWCSNRAVKSRPKRSPKGGEKRRTSRAPSDQAWAMRDTFDGLVEVIKRKSERSGTGIVRRHEGAPRARR